MDLKDIIIILLIICIFGTLIFGSLGSFFNHVGEFVGHVSNGAGATNDKFSVDYLEGKSPNSPSKLSQSDGLNNQKDYSVVDGSNSSKSSASNSGDASSGSSQSQSKSFENYLGISSDKSGSSGSGSSGSGSSKGGNNVYPHNISKNISNITNKTDTNITEKYIDYQINFTTNMSDSENNPIIRSIVSTSGGMVEPGIYEVFWSKLGVINQTRIG